jgi:hypothetical protein
MEFLNMNNKVSCVMTTYRRFHCVERSIAMFLSQDCVEETELIIYNTDTEYPLSLDETFDTYKHKIKIINNNIDFETKQEYTNVGSIRRDALTYAKGNYYITWDDDDLFFPWNIRQCIDGINYSGKSSWKPKYSFIKHLGHDPSLAYNNMEASILTKIEKVREFGFDIKKTGAEHLGWLDSLKKSNDILEDENSIPGYCFYWADLPDIAGHKQSNNDEFQRPDNFARHKQMTTDYAKRPLTLKKIESYAEVFLPFISYFNDYKNKNFELYEKYILPNKKLIFSKPITGRNDSFISVLTVLENEFRNPITLVETGCIRDVLPRGKLGDGWSTLNWEYYCRNTNSTAHVIDISSTHIEASKKIVPESKWVVYHLGDSIEILNEFSHKIDFLFLDSYNYGGDEENIKKCHEHSLNELLSCWDKLNEKCFILIDDVFDENWTGKGKLTIPYLLQNNFEIIHFKDSQVFLKRKHL